ncbi:MAG: methionyl-tRNA formyltransferase [Gammaproteobacteria bacterium]|nr:methionyl-tRNA formyltransferase [Gammaproteobacteria bacterium]
MRVVFAGTPDFAVPSLEVLLDSSLADLVAVYCQPDRPSGRGRTIRPGPVKSTAAKAAVPVYQPEKINTPEAITQLKSLKPDLVVVVAYGALLKKQHLEIPRLGCFNLHASLLPRWRGAAPIQRAIEAGDTMSGVSLMRVVEELDAGPVLAQSEISLDKHVTGGWLHDQLSQMAANLLIQNLPALASGKLKEQTQNVSQATYAKKLGREESWVDWADSAGQIERQIRAFDPWPGCLFSIEGTALKILKASTTSHQESATPGQILQVGPEGIVVQSGQDAIRIEKVQKSGGKAMHVADYLNGHPVRTGIILDAVSQEKG